MRGPSRGGHDWREGGPDLAPGLAQGALAALSEGADQTSEVPAALAQAGHACPESWWEKEVVRESPNPEAFPGAPSPSLTCQLSVHLLQLPSAALLCFLLELPEGPLEALQLRLLHPQLPHPASH